jgi:hypothetical protein
LSIHRVLHASSGALTRAAKSAAISIPAIIYPFRVGLQHTSGVPRQQPLSDFSRIGIADEQPKRYSYRIAENRQQRFSTALIQQRQQGGDSHGARL